MHISYWRKYDLKVKKTYLRLKRSENVSLGEALRNTVTRDDLSEGLVWAEDQPLQLCLGVLVLLKNGHLFIEFDENVRGSLDLTVLFDGVVVPPSSGRVVDLGEVKDAFVLSATILSFTGSPHQTFDRMMQSFLMGVEEKEWPFEIMKSFFHRLNVKYK